MARRRSITISGPPPSLQMTRTPSSPPRSPTARCSHIRERKEQVTASPLIKKSADRAIRLNAQNDNAWHVLGRWHQTLANVSGVKRAVGGMLYGDLPTGSNDESVKCFERAIAINPKRCRHHIELGRTYAQMGREAEAKRSLKQGLALPNSEKDDPEIKARGRDTLAKLP